MNVDSDPKPKTPDHSRTDGAGGVDSAQTEEAQRLRLMTSAFRGVEQILAVVDIPENVWSDEKRQWGKPLKEALKQKSGTVTVEDQALLRPLGLLAHRACDRSGPDQYVDQSLSGADQDKWKGDFAKGRLAARELFQQLLDRYPSPIKRSELVEGKYGELFRGLADELGKTTSYGQAADELRQLTNTSRPKVTEQLLESLDRITETITDQMGRVVIDDLGAKDTDDAAQMTFKTETPRVLKVLKGITDVRAALCTRLFRDPNKSPLDVRMLAELQTQVQGGAGAETKPGVRMESREEQELLAEILANSSSVMQTSIVRTGLGKRNIDAGFQVDVDERLLRPANSPSEYAVFTPRPFSVRKFGREEYTDLHDREKILTDKGIHELVDFLPVTQATYELQTTEVKATGLRGLLGSKDTVTKKVETGSRRVTHKEYVQGGLDEPLVTLRYMTMDGGDKDKQYRDYSGRTGQALTLALALPESVAKKAAEAIRTNPNFLRKLVEQVVLKQQGIPENFWRNGEGNGSTKVPLRPPYEKWSAQHNGQLKVYVAEGPGPSLTFDPANVHAVAT